MIKNLSISLVMPCRNEADHLDEIISSVPDYIDEIIIVSNKSTDSTIEVALSIAKKNKKLKVLEDNRVIDGIGYGFAHMKGISEAEGDIIIGADADGTYPIDKVEDIIKFMSDNSYDFIECHRYPVPKGVLIPFKLKLGVTILNSETKILYGITIKDILSGMWVFRSAIKDELNLNMGDWNLSPQIKINAFTNKNIKSGHYHIKQKPRFGDTKQNYFKTGFNHAIWILKNRFK